MLEQFKKSLGICEDKLDISNEMMDYTHDERKLLLDDPMNILIVGYASFRFNQEMGKAMEGKACKKPQIQQFIHQQVNNPESQKIKQQINQYESYYNKQEVTRNLQLLVNHQVNFIKSFNKNKEEPEESNEDPENTEENPSNDDL